MCVYHHRKLHEGGWRLQYDAADDVAAFADPRGLVRYDARPRTPVPLFGEDETHTNGNGVARDGAGGRDEVGAPDEAGVPNGARSAHAPGVRCAPDGTAAARSLASLNHARGISPDGEALRARYRRFRDIPWEIHARALDALDEAHFGG